MAKIMSFCAHKKIAFVIRWKPVENYYNQGYYFYDFYDYYDYGYSYEDYCDSIGERY